MTELYMDLRGGAGCAMGAHADKLARDSIIWSHLAGGYCGARAACSGNL